MGSLPKGKTRIKGHVIRAFYPRDLPYHSFGRSLITSSCFSPKKQRFVAFPWVFGLTSTTHLTHLTLTSAIGMRTRMLPTNRSPSRLGRVLRKMLNMAPGRYPPWALKRNGLPGVFLEAERWCQRAWKMVPFCSGLV